MILAQMASGPEARRRALYDWAGVGFGAVGYALGQGGQKALGGGTVGEAGGAAQVAGGALGAGGHQQAVVVAVAVQVLQVQDIAGGLAFLPEAGARSAVKVHQAGFYGAVQGLLVHVAEHQHLAGAVVLDYGREQAAAFGKVQVVRIHRRTGTAFSARLPLSSSMGRSP